MANSRYLPFLFLTAQVKKKNLKKKKTENLISCDEIRNNRDFILVKFRNV